jgi:hypothetical protein
MTSLQGPSRDNWAKKIKNARYLVDQQISGRRKGENLIGYAPPLSALIKNQVLADFSAILSRVSLVL